MVRKITESDTRANYIDPQLRNSGWMPENIVREYYFTDGRKLYIYEDADGTIYKNPFDVEITTGKGGDDFSLITARIEIDF